MGPMCLSLELWKVKFNVQNVCKAVMACEPSTCTSQLHLKVHPSAQSLWWMLFHSSFHLWVYGNWHSRNTVVPKAVKLSCQQSQENYSNVFAMSLASGSLRDTKLFGSHVSVMEPLESQKTNFQNGWRAVMAYLPPMQACNTGREQNSISELMVCVTRWQHLLALPRCS